jgi:hypothetical protein
MCSRLEMCPASVSRFTFPYGPCRPTYPFVRPTGVLLRGVFRGEGLVQHVLPQSRACSGKLGYHVPPAAHEQTKQYGYSIQRWSVVPRRLETVLVSFP